MTAGPSPGARVDRRPEDIALGGTQRWILTLLEDYGSQTEAQILAVARDEIPAPATGGIRAALTGLIARGLVVPHRGEGRPVAWAVAPGLDWRPRGLRHVSTALLELLYHGPVAWSDVLVVLRPDPDPHGHRRRALAWARDALIERGLIRDVGGVLHLVQPESPAAPPHHATTPRA